MFLILANVLVILVFAQMDSALAQYLSRQNEAELVRLFSYLIVVNCIVILLFQFLF